MSRPEEMWQCQVTNCGYIYDPARGDKKGKIPPGTRFEDIPGTGSARAAGHRRRCSDLWRGLVRWLNNRANAPIDAVVGELGKGAGELSYSPEAAWKNAVQDGQRSRK